MADVRLTATNPEDSSVVPVACDASGRLLLEEQGVGPQGPPGPQGDPGKDGDPFSGNFADDVTFGGSAEFAGSVTSSNRFHAKAGSHNINDVYLGKVTAAGTWDASAVATTGDLIWGIGSDGSATFADNVSVDKYLTVTNSSFSGSAKVQIQGDTDVAISVYNTGSGRTIELWHDGSATFAGDVTVGSRGSSWMLVEQGGLCHMVEQTRTAVMDEAFTYPKLRDVFKELDLIEEALNTVMEKLRLNPPAGWEVWDGSD